MKSKLLVVVYLISIGSALAQPIIDGEVAIGPSMVSVDGDAGLEHYGGLILGVSANLHLLDGSAGTVSLIVPLTLTIGQKRDDKGLDVQRFHVPIGIMLCTGENLDKPGGLGGGVTIGYGATFGDFTDVVDFRPFANFDLSFGIFSRGMLKLRYFVVLGDYLNSENQSVNYHAILLVGSTTW